MMIMSPVLFAQQINPIHGSCTDDPFSSQGLKRTVEAFFIMMFTLIMVAYTASSMALAIAAGQSVVSVATLLMTISFVFMMVSTDSAPPRSCFGFAFSVYVYFICCFDTCFKDPFTPGL